MCSTERAESEGIMCNCLRDIKKKVKEGFLKTKLENEELNNVCIVDSALMFESKQSIQTFTIAEVEYKKKCKSGRIQTKVKKYNMLHKYCPFCGQAYDAE